WLAPLLAENTGPSGSEGGALAHRVQGRLHFGNDSAGALVGAHETADCGNVSIDVRKSARSKAEKSGSRFEDFGDGLLLIRNGGDHQIGARLEDLCRLGCP